MSQEEREKFWESVMFYNYIQYAQGGPRIEPQNEHWANSEKAFKELLETYSPDYITVPIKVSGDTINKAEQQPMTCAFLCE